MTAVANNVLPEIVVMESDVASNHESGKLPILDIQVWTENGEIKTDFYKKKVATDQVIMARSAIPLNNKRDILTQEAYRRLVNCSPDLPWTVKTAHLTKFCLDMFRGGHSEQFRQTVIRRALAKYDDAIQRDAKGLHPLYRSKKERVEGLKVKGGKPSISDWFKSKGYTNTVTLPATANNELVDRVRRRLEVEESGSSQRTLVLADGGKSISSDLIMSDPFTSECCKRLDCMMCVVTPSYGKCKKSNVGYSIVCNREPCLTTNANGEPELHVEARYEGETARTIYTRSKQHFKKYTGSEEARDQSFMWQHCKNYHGSEIGNMSDFKVALTGQHKSPLDRIIDEATRIRELEQKCRDNHTNTQNNTAGKIICMNSKSEYSKAEYYSTRYMKRPSLDKD